MVTVATTVRPRGPRGLSLPEALISLSITTMLLVAVATAFSSSSQAIESNDTFFRCTQAARVTMNQILAEVRQCDSLDMSTANTIKIIRAAQNMQPNESYRAFVYDATGQRLTLQIFYTNNTSSPVYELANNVTACQMSYDTGLDYNNATIPVRVAIMLTVSTGTNGFDGNTVVLNGAAAPRRAMKY